MVRLTHAVHANGFSPVCHLTGGGTRDCISIMFDRGNSDMKTTVLAAALLALDFTGGRCRTGPRPGAAGVCRRLVCRSECAEGFD